MLVSEAAKKVGMNVQTLRLALQQNKLPFGIATLTTPAEKSKTGKPRYTYTIFPKRLEMYLEGHDEKDTMHWGTDLIPATGGDAPKK